ncbi:MAG: glycogen debranching protein, partial [Lachnospiraceae bacterium]|nr:glycogen debranching protein [Lachnospiraceae bacterium]
MRGYVVSRSETPYPLGAHFYRDGKSGKRNLHIAFQMPACKECGLIIQKGKREERIILPKEFAFGQIISAEISNVKENNFSYLFFADEKRFPDPCARIFPRHREWGKLLNESELFAGVPLEEDFSWGDDKRPMLPGNRSVLYGLHVRGFTRDASAKVHHKGTFSGIIEKLPYLTELGVNGLVLMPVYTFLERETGEKSVNYWGFKRAFYYAPNGAYAAGPDPVEELKTLVKEAHLLGIEVILQFFFPREYRRGDILPVLRHYRIHYHVDGFRLLGEELPMIALCEDPLLSDCKLLCEDFPFQSLHTDASHLYKASRDFSLSMRKFVKGDEGMLKECLDWMQRRSNGHGILNFLADYDGFRLLDAFSYERKHNEPNGEDNRDGSDFNFSWNCGAEGPTRKKGILALRKRLIKNELCLLLLSKGTPYLFMSDEAGGTQQGN